MTLLLRKKSLLLLLLLAKLRPFKGTKTGVFRFFQGVTYLEYLSWHVASTISSLTAALPLSLDTNPSQFYLFKNESFFSMQMQIFKNCSYTVENVLVMSVIKGLNQRKMTLNLNEKNFSSKKNLIHFLFLFYQDTFYWTDKSFNQYKESQNFVVQKKHTTSLTIQIIF